MNFLWNPKFLAVYCGLLTVALAVAVFWGVAVVRNPTLGVISVRRINVVEPDGTVRLTISNRADFPGAWNRKKEYTRPDRTEAAGMLFMNDEGTEQGGLIWGALQLPDGSIENHSHLSFDQYEENQVFALDAGQKGKDKFSRITIEDQGDFPVEEKRKANDEIQKLPPDKQNAAWSKFFSTHRHDVKRMVMGRSPDGSAGLEIRDKEGKVRVVLAVGADDKPRFQFLDNAGRVVKEFSDVQR
jgi:hypothetical protein